MVVGLPTTNRTHSALSRIIGVFINMALFRTDSPAMSRSGIAGSGPSPASRHAQANQECRSDVIRAPGLNGEAGRSLVSVLFDPEKSQSLIEVSGLHIQTMEVSNGLMKFDSCCHMEDTGEELKGILEYDAEHSSRRRLRARAALLPADGIDRRSAGYSGRLCLW
jgi:hypothetical protein